MNTVWNVMPILLVLMFLLGTDLNRQAFANVAKNPKAVLAGMVGQLVLLPLIAFGIAWVLDLPPVYFMGLVLVACCPGGSSSNVFSMLAKGDVALSVTLTAVSSIVTLFTLPFIMGGVSVFVSQQAGVDVVLPVGKLFCMPCAMTMSSGLSKQAKKMIRKMKYLKNCFLSFLRKKKLQNRNPCSGTTMYFSSCIVCLVKSFRMMLIILLIPGKYVRSLGRYTV
jgi:predicted Na+-dependent transporter